MDMVSEIIDIINNNLINNILELGDTERLPERQMITLKDVLEDLTQKGMDSLTFIHIIIDLEDKYEIEFPDELLLMENLNTVSKIEKMIINIKDGEN